MVNSQNIFNCSNMFSKIKSLDVDITDLCNFACHYCYHKKDAKNMSKELMDKVIEICKNNTNIRSIAFMGGEPLVNFDGIKYIMENLKDQKINFSITSNLSLLNEEMFKFLKDNNGRIHPSIDGCKDAHDLHRTSKAGGTYDQVIKAVPMVLALNPDATARMTLMPDTVQYFSKSVKALMGLGFKRVAPSIVYESNWTDDDFVLYRNELQTIARMNIMNPMFYLKTFAEGLRNFTDKKRCGAGRNMISISSEGNITPCHRFSTNQKSEFDSKFYMGNILDEKNINWDVLTSYWNKMVIFDECNACPCFAACSIGCPYTSLSLYGKIDQKNEVHCKYMLHSYPTAKWMFSKIKNVQNIYVRKLNKLLPTQRSIEQKRKEEQIEESRTDCNVILDKSFFANNLYLKKKIEDRNKMNNENKMNNMINEVNDNNIDVPGGPIWEKSSQQVQLEP